MSLYVLDTNAIEGLRGYYPTIFPSFWDRFNALVDDGRILSVAEAYEELQRRARDPHLDEWIERNKSIFSAPSEDEMAAVAQIFRVEHFRALIQRKNLLEGTPVADPWLIARAMVYDACVVTQEAHKPNAARIPNVCEHFDVDWTNLQGLLEREGLRF